MDNEEKLEEALETEEDEEVSPEVEEEAEEMAPLEVNVAETVVSKDKFGK